jgi:hypothetical protein
MNLKKQFLQLIYEIGGSSLVTRNFIIKVNKWNDRIRIPAPFIYNAMSQPSNEYKKDI